MSYQTYLNRAYMYLEQDVMLSASALCPRWCQSTFRTVPSS